MKMPLKFLAFLACATLLFTSCDDEEEPDGPSEQTPCDNGIMDGGETGIDCDTNPETTCPPCAFCGDGELSSILLPDDESGMYEFDVDCGTPECGGCPVELTVEAIGVLGEETPFRDQYSYNRLLSEQGLDTLELDHAQYPGLKVQKVVAAFTNPSHIIVTANQGIQTDSLGILMRTVKLYIPWPEEFVDDIPYLGPGYTIPMVDELEPMIPGFCELPFPGAEVPILIYSERLINNPNLLSWCSFSYVAEGEISELTISHLLGYDQYGYYTKGEINNGSFYSPVFGLPLDDIEGSFTGVNFKFYYPYFP